jgi:FlaA1/EpsC-like NDP-sugar epimerase
LTKDRKRTILVTGATGPVGTEVLNLLELWYSGNTIKDVVNDIQFKNMKGVTVSRRNQTIRMSTQTHSS